VFKIGRTHLMDATPVRLGQEFKGYARQVELAVDRSHKALNAIMELPSAHRGGHRAELSSGFPARAIALLAEKTHFLLGRPRTISRLSLPRTRWWKRAPDQDHRNQPFQDRQ